MLVYSLSSLVLGNPRVWRGYHSSRIRAFF